MPNTETPIELILATCSFFLLILIFWKMLKDNRLAKRKFVQSATESKSPDSGQLRISIKITTLKRQIFWRDPAAILLVVGIFASQLLLAPTVHLLNVLMATFCFIALAYQTRRWFSRIQQLIFLTDSAVQSNVHLTPILPNKANELLAYFLLILGLSIIGLLSLWRIVHGS